MSKRLILPLAAALALGSLAAPAATPKQLPSMVVKFDDLNLDSISGIAKLHRRLNTAAKWVCGPLDSRVLGLREEFDRCVTDAVRRSVEEVGNPKLSAYHRMGRKAAVAASG